MKILLVEDNSQLNKALSTLLKRSSYLVDSAFDGEEALYFINEYKYDVIVLDIMLPKIDGLEVLKRARDKGIETPIIMLTAKSTFEDRITGLDLGADDYLAKPFNTGELMARIRALGRRKAKEFINEKAITFGDIAIDSNNFRVNCGEKVVDLSKKEMDILLLLIKNNGKIISQESLVRDAWDSESFSTNENLYVFISYLRKKLEEIGSKTKIKSIRYQGYYLEYKQ